MKMKPHFKLHDWFVKHINCPDSYVTSELGEKFSYVRLYISGTYKYNGCKEMVTEEQLEIRNILRGILNG